MNLVAKKGDRVTDETGNTVCYVAEDIIPGSTITPSQFKKWADDVPEQKAGSPIWNNRKWLLWNGKTYDAICIEGKWRTTRLSAASVPLPASSVSVPSLD